MDTPTQQKQPSRIPSHFYVALTTYIHKRIYVYSRQESNSRKQIVKELNEIAHIMHDLSEMGVEGTFQFQKAETKD